MLYPQLRFKACFVNRLYSYAIYINEGFVRFPVSPPPRNVATRVILICPISYSPGNLFNRQSILRAIRHLQLLMLLLEYAYPRTHRYPPWNYLRSPSAAPIINKYLSSISFANLGRFELPFSTIRVLFWPLSTRECHPCFTTIGSDTFFPMVFNAYHIPSYLKLFVGTDRIELPLQSCKGCRLNH